jgi:hypothetical protein
VVVVHTTNRLQNIVGQIEKQIEVIKDFIKSQLKKLYFLENAYSK